MIDSNDTRLFRHSKLETIKRDAGTASVENAHERGIKIAANR